MENFMQKVQDTKYSLSRDNQKQIIKSQTSACSHPIDNLFHSQFGLYWLDKFVPLWVLALIAFKSK